VKQLASEALGGEVHLFCGGLVQQDVAIFGEGEGNGHGVGVLHGAGREAEPAGVDAESDLVGGDLDDGVVEAVEPVGGRVAAE